uniref:Uncharacterized protein n=1 Tax=Anopheles atroparvus TaxID=41427 RepID=A0A182IYQ9_ANOAO
MAAQERWENSLRIDFSSLPIKPSETEVHAILARIVGPAEVKRAHLNAVDWSVYIQMKTQEQARECVEQHRGKHGTTINGVYHTYKIELLDGSSEVKILDLPYYVSDETLEREMSLLSGFYSATNLNF